METEKWIALLVAPTFLAILGLTSWALKFGADQISNSHQALVAYISNQVVQEREERQRSLEVLDGLLGMQKELSRQYGEHHSWASGAVERIEAGVDRIADGITWHNQREHGR